MRVVMVGQGEDPRALHLIWLLWAGVSGAGFVAAEALLERAAGMNYAPGQANLSSYLARADHDSSFEWAQKSASQGFRGGLRVLARCYEEGRGCVADADKAKKLYGEAAVLGDCRAQFRYGELAFGECDWERFMWWGRGAMQGAYVKELCEAVERLCPRLERGELGRILHTVAPVVRLVCVGELTDGSMPVRSLEMLERVLELHEAMLRRARRAIACWSMAGRRCGVVKDMRVMIAKMVWEEPWRWGEKVEQQSAPKRANVG
jgi:hypothetical protein